MVTFSNKDIIQIARRAAVVGHQQAVNEAIAEKTAVRDQMMAERKALRMAEDLQRIQATHLWPGRTLRMKTQPWITEGEGKIFFGWIEADDPLIVRQEGNLVSVYDSLEDLVEVWSVD